MESYRRKTVNDKLNKYCCLSNDDSDFIEVTEWNNGEGIDVGISTNNEIKLFSLTYGELDAINYLKMTLDYEKF